MAPNSDQNTKFIDVELRTFHAGVITGAIAADSRKVKRFLCVYKRIYLITIN